MKKENFGGFVHEGIFSELKSLLEESHQEQQEKIFSHGSGEGFFQKNSFSNKHIEHEEFVDETHQKLILELLDKMVDSADKEQLTSIYNYLLKIKTKCEIIGNENAKNLNEKLEEKNKELKEKIGLHHGIDQNLSEEDFSNKLIEIEHLKFSNLLGENFDSKNKIHIELLTKKSRENKESLLATVDAHSREYLDIQKIEEEFDSMILDLIENGEERKVIFEKASEEEQEKLEDLGVIPRHIQEGISVIGKVFKESHNWAIIGSSSVALQSENPPEKVDDIDISFDLNEINSVIKNLDTLTEKGLIYKDPEGKEKGYINKEVNLYGESKMIKGFIDSHIPDPKNPGKNILVEFEAFGESTNKGISQIGNVEKDIKIFEKEGEKIHFIGKEGLKDQYVINLLYEFGIDKLENYKSSDIKAKDLMRIEKMRLLGCNLMEGIIEAIKRSSEKYKEEDQDERLRKVLRKKDKLIKMLQITKNEYNSYLRNHNGERSEEKIDKFPELFEKLKNHKFFLRESYNKLKEIQTSEELVEIHDKILKRNQVFEEIFENIKKSPEGKELHFFAVKRLVEKFIKEIYREISFSIDYLLNKGKIDYKKIESILFLSQKYSEDSLINN